MQTLRLVALLRAVGFLLMLFADQQTFNDWGERESFKTAAVCLVVIVICGCDRGQPTPPVAPDPTPVATPVENMELPESPDSIGMEFKLIPAGTFTMGAADVYKTTPHEVTLTQPFNMGVHEVTQAQYEQVMGVNPSHFKGAENPVEKVSGDDAVEFCRRLSDLPAEKAAGNVYRLPSEAEWEYACRAGRRVHTKTLALSLIPSTSTTKYSFGDK